MKKQLSVELYAEDLIDMDYFTMIHYVVLEI